MRSPMRTSANESQAHWPRTILSHCTHIFLVYIHCAYISHILLACYTHAWLKIAVRMSSSLFVAPSPFSCFTRLRLLFLHGHFETNLTDALIHPFLPNFPDLKAQVKRTPHEDELFGYLAKFLPPTGYEPKEFDKITSVDDDTMNINDPNHNFSDFSNTTNENTRQFGVPTVFEFSVSHVSHNDLALQMESKESMQSGNRLLDRKRGKRRFSDQCCRVDVKERSTEQYLELFSSDSHEILL